MSTRPWYSLAVYRDGIFLTSWHGIKLSLIVRGKLLSFSKRYKIILLVDGIFLSFWTREIIRRDIFAPIKKKSVRNDHSIQLYFCNMSDIHSSNRTRWSIMIGFIAFNIFLIYSSTSVFSSFYMAQLHTSRLTNQNLSLFSRRGCSSVVERPLCMRKARGSIPLSSIFFLFL